MENDRESEKKTEEDASMSANDDDGSLYVTASDQPAQITINLDKDNTKRKITIISEVESPKRSRRPSADLRRQAMVNNARRRSQSTASSRSRSRSRGRSVSRSRRPSAPRQPSITRSKSPSKAELLAQIGGKSFTISDSKSGEKDDASKKTPKKVTPKIRSRSSTRSRSLSRSRSRSRSTRRGRSVPRRRSNKPTTSRSRSLSRSRSRPLPPLQIPMQALNKQKEEDEVAKKFPKKNPISPNPIVHKKKESDETPQTRPLRLPTHLCKRTVVGRNGRTPPEYIQLPSPLFILTEQQTIGACEKQTVQFVTKILLTSHKLSEEDKKKLYAEMVEAEYVGTSRSSTDLSKEKSDEEPEEDFQLKIYYSAKGIYIHSVQNVRKIRNGKKSRITEEKSYSNICKTKIIGELGKSAEGLLNVTCSETVSVENQNYTRSEHFKIGFKDMNVVGDSTIHAVKTTFDPTKTTSFDEVIKFDSKNIGIDIFHTRTAAMETMWSHEMGSFGEEQSEYREVRFFFEDGNIKKEQMSTPKVVAPLPETPKPSTPNTTSGSSTPQSSASESSRRSRSRSKRHKAIAKKALLSNKTSNVSKSPDRQSSKKSARPDEEPIKGSGIKKLDSTSNNSSFYHSFPEATSTPKSPKNSTNSSILQSNAKSQTTPDKSPLRRGAISIREHSEKHSDNEIDLDKSLSSKKPTAAKNLAQIVEFKKKEEARQNEIAASMISGKPPTSPGNSVYMYQTGSSNNSTYMTAKDLYDARVSAASSSKSSTSPQGIRRIKETKVTREVREEDGKPAEINEKKEETVKEEKVKLGKRSRSVSPATPNMKRPFDKSMVTLSAVKETHQTLEMTPIKVSDESAPTQSSSINSGQRAFKEEVQMELLIDKKRLVLNVNFMLLAEKQPEVEITGFCFKGQKLWEKSSEWSLSSANTTSHTKTVARQASDILGDSKENGQEKK